MKKKVLMIAVAAALILATVAGSLAYFTDDAEKENTFTMGEVDIDLTETAEEGTDDEGNPIYPGTENKDKTGFDYEDVVPGAKYSKKPVIGVEEGSQPAYVFAEIIVAQYSDIYQAMEDAGLDPTAFGTNFLYKPNYGKNTEKAPVDCWVDDDDKFHIVYTNGVMKDTDAGWTLFEAVQVPAEFDGEFAENGITKIVMDIKAYGIQETGIKDAAAAWLALDVHTPATE